MLIIVVVGGVPALTGCADGYRRGTHGTDREQHTAPNVCLCLGVEDGALVVLTVGINLKVTAELVGKLFQWAGGEVVVTDEHGVKDKVGFLLQNLTRQLIDTALTQNIGGELLDLATSQPLHTLGQPA